ncbi:MAG: sulfur oxidation c-type cytochrome SoxA [Chromatiales bacterium]|nr:sulfur oxidation c-type cytochrome SoxA [Chromatiales bacterium]
MKTKYILITFAVAIAMVIGGLATADYQDDIAHYQAYIKNKFPNIDPAEFANGAYAFSEDWRANWEAIEEFPPYGIYVDDGEEMWNTPFANGKGYKDCFPDGPAIRGKYPHWDSEQGMVMTLALAINQCREKNGEEPLAYMKGPIASLLAYIAYQSRGQVTNVVVPEDDPRAMQAYKNGKEFYFQRRGQLNFSCAHCHFDAASKNLRTDVLSAAVGQTTGWPVYRSKWNELGTLHRRYSGCNKQVRSKPFPAQGEEYRNLEYFHTSLSNGYKFNGPSARK